MGQKSVQVSLLSISDEGVNFVDLLTNSSLEKPSHYSGKTIQLKYLEDKGEYVIGLNKPTASA